MFITFEGPEGSGKSTQIHLLAQFLRDQGQTVIITREPGGTAIGDEIRACLHNVAHTNMTSATELLLYSASRAQLVADIIRPALAAGQFVLSDRFFDSTFAYQGYGRGLDLDLLKQITYFATNGLQPDLTFLLDLPVATGLQRRQQNGDEMNRLDRESITFHQKVRAGYHELAAQHPRWCLINADQSVAAVQTALREQLTAVAPQF
ncbi:MAG TPA: dTMP kinase [Anaerolineae bacterium]|nr:dTMP kinase [Anaerolineae bacterium]